MLASHSEQREITSLLVRWRALLLAWGPEHVVAEEFADLTGAEQVIIFGSWAARYHNLPGPPPNDLDVLVIGAPARDDVYDAADRAEQRLGLPVNPVIRTPAPLRDRSDPLIQQIQASPHLEVLTPDENTVADRTAEQDDHA